MVRLDLDPLGRLIYLEAVAPQVEESRGPPPAFDWNRIFRAAGLDPARFSEVEPKWTPLTAFDRRAAWTGTYPDRPEISLRVEAASWQGRPVFFRTIAPWTRPEHMGPSQRLPAEQLLGLRLWWVLTLVVLIGASLLARHNMRLGRGDRRGAIRLAWFVFSVSMLAWLFASNHAPTIGQIRRVGMGLSESLFIAAILWLVYMAMEPYVRRRWPQTLISWSRVLAGRLRDPLVGRDLLVGVIFGIAWTLSLQCQQFMIRAVGEARWTTPQLDSLLGVRHLVGRFLTYLPQAIAHALVILFVVVLVRTLMRKQWLAGGISVVLLTAVVASGEPDPAIGALIFGMMFGGLVTVLMRFGLLSLATGFFVDYVLRNFPITNNFSAWYAGTSLFALLSVLAVAIYGSHAALVGRPEYKNALVD
jgi:serine/threonine-protein kinase